MSRNWWVVLLLAVLLPFTVAAACNRPKDANVGDPRQPEYNKELPANPPEPRQPVEDGKLRTVVITANVEDAYAPYRVVGSAIDTVTRERQELNEPIVGGPFTKILTYEAGHTVVIDVTVTPARPGSPNGYLIIKDGQFNKEVKKFEGGTRISIQGFTTKR